MNTDIFRFDGYCPESKLRGEKVEMRLNKMDFYESEKTGLQITIFPPYAAILRWRGEGKFRQRRELASQQKFDAILTKADWRNGKEFYPDVNEIFENSWDLDIYIQAIHKNEKEFKENKIDLQTELFVEQTSKLEKLTPSDGEELLRMYMEAFIERKRSEAFNRFFNKVYELGLIFSFNWPKWYEGNSHLKKENIDYSSLTLLEMSMYLTMIFRSDKFDEGTIEHFNNNGVLGKLLNQLNNKICKK